MGSWQRRSMVRRSCSRWEESSFILVGCQRSVVSGLRKQQAERGEKFWSAVASEARHRFSDAS
jgi:hypothetical protein